MKLPLGFPGGSAIKNPPAMQETQEIWVLFLGQEDLLEKEMATQSTILSWEKSHGQKSLAGYSPEGLKTVGHDLVTKQNKAKKNKTKDTVSIQR